jgi:dipeptidyl aminopeptidase/acylaminoacyl peptidase
MIRASLAAMFLLSAASLPAAPLTTPGLPQRVLGGADLFSLEAAADPQISPDGQWIAYVRQSGDIMTDRMQSTIWLIDVRTGAQTPLVTGPGSHGSPRWSPDGKRLAYVSSMAGSAQLFVRWMTGGAATRITGLPEAPSAITWAPDGSRIAYVMTVPDEGLKLGSAPAKPEGAKWAPPLEIISAVTYRADDEGYLKPGYSHVFVVPSDGGAARELTYGSFNDGGPLSWTRDGHSILFSAHRAADWERNPANSDIYAVDATTGALTQITNRLGPDDAPAVSPDGRQVAYVGYDDKFIGYQNSLLYVMNRDGSGAHAITSGFDRSVDHPVWARDGRSIYVQYDDKGMTRVARVSLDGKLGTVAEGLVQSELDRPYTGGSYSVSDNGVVAFTSGTAYRPADVSVASGKGAHRLTRLNEDLLGSKLLGQVRKLPVTAPDRRSIDAWMVMPPEMETAKKYPLILEIHGGPFAAYGPSFSTDDQLYAAAGYVVLYVNPRGSTSYGDEFANLINHAYPGHDYDDLMAAVDAAIADGHVDPNNLFVTGGSGGGLLTAWIVGKTDRFKAAASQKPVINWVSEALTMDMTPFTSKYWFAKMPWEDPQGYWARSPLSLVGNVKTPTLVVVGSQDYRTPDSEAEQYYAALQLRGVPTALVKVPEASHHMLAGRPSQSAAKTSAILAWFARYRTPAP